MRDFAGKTAFVTGGAAGIGLALGRAFAQSGMKVMLADIETDALALAVKSLKKLGPAEGVICDVAANRPRQTEDHDSRAFVVGQEVPVRVAAMVLALRRIEAHYMLEGFSQ